MNDPRQKALETLAFFDQNGYIPFRKVEIAISTLSSIGRRFYMNLVMETLRKRIQIDYILNQFLKKPEKLPAPVMNALRLGVTQLFYMDSVPEFAAIHSSVELLKAKSFKKLVNAVLRKISKLETPLPEQPIWLKYSHPKWLVDYWEEIEWINPLEELLSYNQQPPLQVYSIPKGEYHLLDEKGYIYDKSDFSDCIIVLEKGEPISSLKRIDELEYIVNEYFRCPVIKPENSSLALLSEKPWLFHTISKEELLKSANELKKELSNRIANIEEFVYLSNTLTLEENTQLLAPLKEFVPVPLDDFMIRYNLRGTWDGYGYWLLPPNSPRPGYIARMRRK
ncbi:MULTISPECIES: transcription antitermination factor NusB [Kosmotoga]|uniref:NusB/RsmB/TIM44 n=1 Tax=Kosmotoga olearia (strain ATCC BAA-1733 / DSM 21960 / TBF 19.5.1) TaxID=521045 RepID=C5CGV6_KOSOT|nr:MULTISPECIES: transcription antitermination factor NusB [Kosmotoga]ACR80625.1 NusB/RsmB/TIM44 [Kosmotoga olearia TBF 19.5.1]MDI3523245.1 rRNA (cytosine967-C5)-methyltransferase [Kosmotoga sp.]MDK2952826.1 rRNA (cytosine967-C5)-methyltransferase [Kosmotoga sp.]OAA19491.1 hypothetical protein DU53_10600 [Kosmotoga sp. DU53]